MGVLIMGELRAMRVLNRHVLVIIWLLQKLTTCIGGA